MSAASIAPPVATAGTCRGDASPVLCFTVALSGAVSVVGDGVGDTFDTPKACGEWAAGTKVGDLTLRLMPSAFTVADHELGFDAGAEYPGPGTYDLADVAAVGDGQVSVDGRVFEHRRGATSTATVTFVADGSGRLEFTGLVELGATGNELSGSMRWTCGDARDS